MSCHPNSLMVYNCIVLWLLLSLTLAHPFPFTHHLLQVLLLAYIHHDQAFFDEAETHILLGVGELYCDVRAGNTRVLHVKQALGIVDVPHNTVHHVSPGVLLQESV